MKRREPRSSALKTFALCAATTAGTVLGSPHAVEAQTAPGIALNRFEPSERGSEWFANDTLDIRGPFRLALGVVGDYGRKPYVLLNPDGSEQVAIVSDQLFLHVGASLVLLDRLRLGVNLPIAALQEGSPTGGRVNGQTIVANPGAGIGDVRLGATLRLVGTYGDAFTLALGGRVWLPTGDAQKYLGDDGVRAGPNLAFAGDLGAFAYAATVGVVYRANSQPFAGHPTGTEASFGLAMGIRAFDRKLLIGPEIFGNTNITTSNGFLGERTTPLALLGSAHLTAGSFRFGLGAGPGLSHAAGTAVFRGLASIEFVPGIADPPTEAPPSPPPQPPSDRDRDMVLDAEDACPDTAGVRTGDPRTNGCPADRDGDSIVDSDDACPDVAGIRTDDPKTNGCPPDRDRDGVLDANDACPDLAGVKTDDPKTNGCPSDRDKDRIVDAVDACPDEPGPANSDPKKNGCPLAFVKNDEIKITDQVKFRFGLASLDPASDIVLDAVLKVVQTHSEIEKIRIEGHTDNKGSAALNQRLSDGRAAAVANWLVKHGVERSRVTSVGHGLTKPVDTNDTDAGRANNRRVEFHIEAQRKTDR